MDIITKDVLEELINNVDGKAVSIYMRTFPTAQEAKQNPIRLKNLISDVEAQLKKAGISQDRVKTYLAPLRDLVNDEFFWQDQSEGLALFVDASELRIFRVPERFDEIATVGDHFHLTPLIPVYQGNGPFYLLSLAQNRPQFFQGSKFKLMQIEDADLPESLQEMFDDFFEFHSHLSFHNKTITPNPDLAADRGGMYFSQSGGDDIEKKAEIKNFFHRFDQALMAYLGDKEIPLVLAGVDFLHPLYKQASSYPNLLEEGITKNVDQMPVDKLHELSWKIVQDQYQKDVDQALNVFHQLKAKDGETTTDIKTIVPAAFHQRIQSLFIDEDARIWGRFDDEENSVIIDDEEHIDNEDLISLAASQALLAGGHVFLIPEEKMPEGKQAAAILRY